MSANSAFTARARRSTGAAGYNRHDIIVNTIISSMSSLSVSMAIFPGGPGLAGTRMSPFWILLVLKVMEVVVTTGAIRRAKLQSNRHQQQTNTQPFTCRMPFLLPNQQCQSIEGKFTINNNSTDWSAYDHRMTSCKINGLCPHSIPLISPIFAPFLWIFSPSPPRPHDLHRILIPITYKKFPVPIPEIHIILYMYIILLK